MDVDVMCCWLGLPAVLATLLERGPFPLAGGGLVHEVRGQGWYLRRGEIEGE